MIHKLNQNPLLLKKTFLLLSFSFFCYSNYGQTNFRKGYIINHDSTKVNGFFKKAVWTYSPSYVLFKAQGKNAFDRIPVSAIIEFGIDYEIKFVMAKVKFDPSNDRTNLSVTRDLDLKESLVALEVVIEGGKNLYKLKTKYYERFFYKLPGNPIKPLLYKRYKLIDSPNRGIVSKEKENTSYILQLREEISCHQNDPKEEIPVYKEDELTDYFLKNHQCTAEKTVKFISSEDNSSYQIFLLTGYSSSKLTAVSTGFNPDLNVASYKDENSVFIGVGFRLYTPSRKIALSLETSYHTPYKSNALIIKYPERDFDNPIPIDVNYSFLRNTLGLNYYFFLDNHWSIYLSGKGNLDLTLADEILVHPEIIKQPASDFDTSTDEERTRRGDFKRLPGSLSIGCGMKYKKISFEVYTLTDRNLFNSPLTSGMKSYAFQLSYDML